MDQEKVLTALSQLNRSLQRIGFGDGVAGMGAPDFGAIEGLTVKLVEALSGIEHQLQRIADYLDENARPPVA